MILTILFRGQEYGKKTSTLVPETTLFNETKAWQILVRNADVGSAGHELLPQEFSCLISTLVGWNLIREETGPANGEEKVYSITPEGELALIVCSARMKKRGVARTPGLTCSSMGTGKIGQMQIIKKLSADRTRAGVHKKK
ncbi:MAG: hypothetical protein EHM53_01780 [Methanoregulaceae archaeon]|nr:MAG: hypothetical protein EHM53_01780 [Methanoregulaceae archaeon]